MAFPDALMKLRSGLGPHRLARETALIVVALAALAGCSRATEAPRITERVRFFDEDARRDAAEAESDMLAPRTPVTLDVEGRRRSAASCQEYLALLEQGAEPATDADASVALEYAYCGLFRAVLRATPVRRSNFDSPLGSTLYRHLDLTTVRTSLAPSVPDGKFTLESIFAEASVSQHAVEIHTSDWDYTLRVLAAGDFDGDGREDLVVLFIDDAREGTFLITSTLILVRPDPAGPVRAAFPPPPR